jgi:hypothetical protein
MSRTILKWLVVAGLLFPLFAAAQESSKQAVKAKGAVERESSAQEVSTQPPAEVYRLDYVIHELDNGKQINQRKYSLSVEATQGRGGKDWGQVRVGRRVPVATGADSKQIQYMEVGMNLDCALRQQDGSLLLESRVEMSSVVTGGALAAPGAPVTRQARANMVSVLTPGKPTVIGTLDDVDSTRSYQIEVTATRMK